MAWYYVGIAAHFASGGIHSVLYPWILTAVLHKPAAFVGIAQMVALLPMALFVLFGGASADRRELRRQLLTLQMALWLPQGALLLLIGAGQLTYPLLLGYGAALAVLGAFIMPARDAFLPILVRRSGSDLAKAIALATGAQFGGQMAGLAMAGTASTIGPMPLVAAAMALIGLAAFATTRLGAEPPLEAREDRSLRAMFHEIADGLAQSARDERVRAVVIMLFGGGVLFMGMFLVGMPILVRDVYGGGSQSLALLNIWFMAGVMVSTIILTRLRPIRRRGRAMMLATGGGVFAVAVMHFAPPEPLLHFVMFVWGATGGVSMSMSRAIVQDAALDSHRGRIISVYQLAQLGGGPLGALSTGFFISWLGVLDAMLIPLGGIVFLWLGIFALTPLWRVERAPAG